MLSVRSIAILVAWFALSGVAPVITLGQCFTVNPCLRQPVKLPAFLDSKTLYINELLGSVGPSSVRTAHNRCDWLFGECLEFISTSHIIFERGASVEEKIAAK